MGLLSPYYDLTFDGVQAWELAASGYYPGMDVTSEGTLYSHGGGVHTYVDMGRSGGIFSIVVGVEGTQAAALISKRGVTGSLVWSRGTQSATLLDILPTEADIADANTLTLRFFSDDFPSTIIASGARATESGDVRVTESGDTRIVE